MHTDAIADTPPVVLTAIDIACRYQISREYVYLLAARGELPSIRIGRAVRFDPRDVAAWAQALRRPAR